MRATGLVTPSTPSTEPPTELDEWIPGIVLGIFALLAVQAVGLFGGAWGPLDGTFTGPDSYMRLHRVLECGGGGACSGGLLERSNAPYGEALHWPWLWDWAILTVAAPFRLFMDGRQAAITAAYLMGPLVGVIAVVITTLVARRLNVSRGLPFVGVIAVAQPYFSGAFAYSRPDHHGLLTALFIAGLLGAAHALTHPDGWGPRLAGLAIGTGLWASTEGLITAVPLIAALGLAWTVLGGQDLARANRTIAMWTALVALIGVVVDGPTGGPLSADFDRLSIVHVVLFAVVAGFWACVTRWEAERGSTQWLRAGATVGGAAAALALMTLVFPGFERGPTSGIPELLWTSWLNHTAEYVPLTRRTDPTEILMALAPFLLAFPVTLWAAMKTSGSTRYLWWTLVSALLWFEGLATLQQIRWTTYVQLLSIFPLAWLLGQLLKRANAVRMPLGRSFIRVTTVATVALAPVLIAVAVGLRAGLKSYDTVDACAPSVVIETLAGLNGEDGGPARVLAPIFWGPEILFRTDQEVVATPYHRNVQGIRDSYRIMRGTSEAARAVLSERGISHIATCPDLFWMPMVERAQEDSFYSELVEGDYPSWVRQLELPEDAPGVRILEVLPAL